jgi:hypothetical protein
MTTPLMTVDMLATHFGGQPELVQFWLDREGVELAADGAVPIEMAARVVSKYQTALANHATKAAAFEEYLRSRERDRKEMGIRAFHEAVSKYQEAELRALRESTDFVMSTSGLSGYTPGATAAGREAQRVAHEEYDKRHPKQDFATFSMKAK